MASDDWVHFAFMRDKKEMRTKFFLNGVQVSACGRDACEAMACVLYFAWVFAPVRG